MGPILLIPVTVVYKILTLYFNTLKFNIFIRQQKKPTRIFPYRLNSFDNLLH